MKKRYESVAMVLTLLLVLLASYAGAQTQSRKPKTVETAAAKTVAPQAGPNLPVIGSGTIGRLPKWTGFTSSNSVLGDSAILEDKDGRIGIGTPAPTSKLTVQGMIETTLGGVKFPDGTVQSSAALSSLNHDNTLTGNGTQAAPLGIHIPLQLLGTGQVLTVGTDNTTITNSAALTAFATKQGMGMVGATSGYSPTPNTGVMGVSDDGNGVVGRTETGVAVLGYGGHGLAAKFHGKVEIINASFSAGDHSVAGTLSAAVKNFKIDHSLDPENKYLNHMSGDSPDMKNIYDGVVKLDSNGEAMIEMPQWFSALNRDFRYLLTAVGAPAPGLYVAEELADNRFKVAGGVPGMKVSWQVTGIRQDAWANKHRVPVEENKAEKERGFYLHPEVFNQPKEKGVEGARDPELMKQLTETRPKQQ